MKFVSLPTGAVTEFDDDVTVKVLIDCAGTDSASSAPIPTNFNGRLVAVCRRVDASNFAVGLSILGFLEGREIEIVPENGSIEIFAQNFAGASTFMDGSASITTSVGVKLRQLIGHTAMAWAVI